MGNIVTFQRIGECLYRNSASGSYYALVKLRGKQFKQSLRTDNLAEARRKLSDFKRDLEKTEGTVGRVTVDALVERFLPTIAGQALGTIRKKKQIAELVMTQWRGVQAKSLKKSDVLAWLAHFPFSASTRNKYLRILREIFALRWTID